MARASQPENVRPETGRGGPIASGGDAAGSRQGAGVETFSGKGSPGGRYTQAGCDARIARGGLCFDNEKAVAFPSPSPIVQSYAERFREDGRLADSMTVIAVTSKNRSPHDLQRVCRKSFTTRRPDSSQSSTTSARLLRPHRGQVREANRTVRRTRALFIGRALRRDEDIEYLLSLLFCELPLRVDSQAQ